MKAIFSCLFIILAVITANSQQRSFEDVLGNPSFKLKHPNFTLETFCNPAKGIVNKKILEEYGAYIVAKDIFLPDTCIFENEADVSEFFCELKGKTKFVRIANRNFEFQKNAADSLISVISILKGLGIKPETLPRKYSDGNDIVFLRISKSRKDDVKINADWAARSYENTLTNWENRGVKIFDLSDEDRKEKIKARIEKDQNSSNQSTPIYEYVKPIMRSAAIPGASQHTLLIAFDLNYDICNTQVIGKLNEAGWYETVPNDDCHFTYLGWKTNDEMKNNGLKKVKCKINGGDSNNHRFWIPRITNFSVYKNWDCTEVGV